MSDELRIKIGGYIIGVSFKRSTISAVNTAFVVTLWMSTTLGLEVWQAYDLIYLLAKRTDEKDQLVNGGGLVDAQKINS